MDGSSTTLTPTGISIARRSETILSLGLLGVLVVLLVPLPSMLLDMLLAVNFATTILLLLITVNVMRPLDISVFPSLLLLMTLYRLSLNVATTRLILLSGDAGRIVSTFGGFVVGGNLVVGLVIFLILVVIQFIVITKGAGRVSEVAARFTLDAMPGKQMAIDAELSSGAIDEKEARRRREYLAQESEFYGAMDGAGKFVRGDAIAGLVITAINLIGGVVLGMSGGLSIGEAVQRYSILTVGDGLVSQIPALIIATAAGILVTKATTKLRLGNEIGRQMLTSHRPLALGAVILSAVAMTPGLPKLPFLLLAGGLMVMSLRLRREVRESAKKEKSPPPAEKPEPKKQNIEEFVQHDRACVEIGVRLISLVNDKDGMGLADRIGTLRADLTRKYGIWVPPIRMRDSLHLPAECYRVLIGGREVARGVLRQGKVMAISADQSSGKLDGESTQDPAFGLPAFWIDTPMQQRAEMKGFTVVDPSTVLITHLGELLRKYAHELLSREDLRNLLEQIHETSPTIVDEVRSDVIRMSDLHQVLVLLLKERVPLTNLTRLLEHIVQLAPKVGGEPVELAERVRVPMGRDILDRLRDENGRVSMIVLEPLLEARFKEHLLEGQLNLPHEVLERFVAIVSQSWEKCHIDGHDCALMVDASLRRILQKVVDRALPELTVCAYLEVPSEITIDIRSVVKRDEVMPPNSAEGDVRRRRPSPVTAVA